MKPHASGDNKSIKNIIFEGRQRESDFEIAEAFNKFFSTIGTNISLTFPDMNDQYQDYLSQNSISNSFFFSPIHSHDISIIIKSLKNKTCHHSLYPVSVIKYLDSIISPILSKIINKSFCTSSFPNFLKKARVIPLHKGGNNDNPSNYRPISILPVFSKIIEKIVHKQLYSFLEKLSILNANQFGFCKGISTSNVIIDHLKYVYDYLDRGWSVMSIFLDFSKVENLSISIQCIIDENLRFQEHVKYISSKLSKSLGILFRLNKFFSSNI